MAPTDTIALSLPETGRGFTLVELVLAVALAALLTLSILAMAMTARQSFRAQEASTELQESARYFEALTRFVLDDAGFTPIPWVGDTLGLGISPASLDAQTALGDRVVVRSLSDRNCQGLPNPQVDAAGQPRFWLREQSLELANGNVLHSCLYGPDAASLSFQIRRQPTIPEVNVLQIEYGEDLSGAGRVESWVTAGELSLGARVLSIRLALLLQSREPVEQPAAVSWGVFNSLYQAAADGRLRQLISYRLPVQAVVR